MSQVSYFRMRIRLTLLDSLYLQIQWLNTAHSTINVLFSIDKVQEAVCVLVPFVNFFQFCIWFDHIFLIGKEHKTFLSCKSESLAENCEDFTDGESLRHHEPINKSVRIWSVWKFIYVWHVACTMCSARFLLISK